MTIYSFDILFPNLEPVCCSMSSSNCCLLTWMQVSQDPVQVAWYSRLLQNFLKFVVIHTIKGFGVVNEGKLHVFLRLSCFFYDPMDVSTWISGFPGFSKSSLKIWMFTFHVLLKPVLENFEYHFANVWDDCNCLVVWIFFGIPFFGTGIKMDLFQSCGLCWVFQITFFFWETYNLNVGPFDIVLEVSETIITSYHPFYFILLFRNYFHHFIFQLTDSFFCFRYSVINSF